MFHPPDYSHPDSFLRPRFGPWTVMMAIHRKAILAAVERAIPNLTGRLLDVGCGNKPYRGLLTCSEHLGIDVELSPHNRSEFDMIFDGQTIPFETESFDSVLCTEVLEHAREPRRLATEINRVLKPGGHALLTVPFVFPHHEQPYDFHRFTRFGLEELAKQAGFDVAWVSDRGGVFTVLAQQIDLAISQLIATRPISDLLHWTAFPAIAICRLLDRIRFRPDVLTPGWQMLVRKQG